MQTRRQAAGYSLIELLIALLVGGILLTLGFASYDHYFRKARVSQAISDIFGIDVRIGGFYALYHRYPETLAEIGGAPLDPWGNPYRYLNIQTAKNRGNMRKDKNLVPINGDYDLYSMGEDGLSVPPLTAKASQDDIVRANNGAYIGPAENY